MLLRAIRWYQHLTTAYALGHTAALVLHLLNERKHHRADDDADDLPAAHRPLLRSEAPCCGQCGVRAHQ